MPAPISATSVAIPSAPPLSTPSGTSPAIPPAIPGATPSGARVAATTSLPWWRYGHVWLVLAGPAAVVVAGIATVVIAMHGADPVIGAGHATARSTQAPSAQASGKAMAPAQALRNHAATPDADLPPLQP